LCEQIALPDRELLPVPVQQVKQLRLQRRSRTVGIKVGEERILGLLEESDGVQPCCESLGERGLTDANRSFNRDVLKGHVSEAPARAFSCMLS
jgi:hypothetical protein